MTSIFTNLFKMGCWFKLGFLQWMNKMKDRVIFDFFYMFWYSDKFQKNKIQKSVKQ